MTFADVKTRQASEKIAFVRIEPAKLITGSLSLDSGDQYIDTLGFAISKVERNGVVLTKDSGLPSVDTWTHNEVSGELRIRLASAPASETNEVVVFFYIFATNSGARAIPEDITSGPLRNWEPLLKSLPSTAQSIKNILSGVFTISETFISLINAEDFFSQFNDPVYSFYNKSVDIWLALNSTDNLIEMYGGRVGAIPQITNLEFKLPITDPFEGLKAPAYFGDTSDQVYATKTGFPSIDERHRDEVIPLIIGKRSRFRLRPDSTAGERIDPTSLLIASNSSFSTSISTTTNRTWVCGRVLLSPVIDSTPINNSDQADPNFTVLTVSSAASFDVGDHIRTSNPDYGRILAISGTLVTTTKLPTGTGTLSGDAVRSVILVKNSGEEYYLLPGRDYATSFTATASNYRVDVILTDNFEATFGIPDFDPGEYTVYVKLRGGAHKHADVVSRLLTDAGIVVNAASITAANTALDVNTALHVPFFDESDYKPYYRYLEEILTSTFGYVALNLAFEAKYVLFDTPSVSETIDDNLILRDTFRGKLDYSGLASTIIAFNPHASAAEPLSSSTETTERVRLLHGVDVTRRFRHVLEKIDGRLPAIFAQRSERLATYSFSTKTQHLDTELGDDLTLSNDITTGDKVVTGLGKTGKVVKVDVTDIT